MTRTVALISLLMTLAACQRRSPFGDLEWRHGPTQVNLDRLAGRPIVTGTPFVLESGSEQPGALCGWAIDAQAKQLATGVVLVIDGRHTFVAKYGTERKDVAEALHQPAFAQAGFELRLAPSDLPRGNHTVSAMVLSADGRGYYRSDHEWAIAVR